MSEVPREYRTKTGRILTESDVEKLAAEAERGYDISAIELQQRIDKALMVLQSHHSSEAIGPITAGALRCILKGEQ